MHVCNVMKDLLNEIKHPLNERNLYYTVHETSAADQATHACRASINRGSYNHNIYQVIML